MRFKVLVFFWICIFLFPCISVAQSIRMDAGYVAYSYPDNWFVLSPQRCRLYAPYLEEQGIDAEILSEEMDRAHVLSRAYSPDFSQWISVQMWTDENSQRLFDISRAELGTRRQIRSRMENNSLWEKSGMRTQDAEWQQIQGRYWLYVHYILTDNGETSGRGLRYLTVHNGQYIVLDWQIQTGRFSNRDLSTMKSRVQNLVFLQEIEEPMQEVALQVDLPTETSTSRITISGTSTPGAEISLTLSDERYGTRQSSVVTAGARGGFTIEYNLEGEGETELTLTAHAEDMIDVQASSMLTYSSKTIPVSGLETFITSTADSVTIHGHTLPSSQMQLVSPFGLTKKNSGNDGNFTFELTTKDEGSYDYTLVIDKKGYTTRRFSFTIVRVKTDDEQKNEIRKSAVKISYKDLQKGLDKNEGQIMNLYGPVTEVSTGGNQTYLRMNFTKNVGARWSNPVIIVCNEDPGVRAGNMISAVVTVDGVYVEQNNVGEDVNVPRFQLLFIDRIE